MEPNGIKDKWKTLKIYKQDMCLFSLLETSIRLMILISTLILNFIMEMKVISG